MKSRQKNRVTAVKRKRREGRRAPRRRKRTRSQRKGDSIKCGSTVERQSWGPLLLVGTVVKGCLNKQIFTNQVVHFRYFNVACSCIESYVR